MSKIGTKQNAVKSMKDIAVGQVFMVYLKYEKTYWPAKIVNVPKIMAHEKQSYTVTTELYQRRDIATNKAQKMLINLEHTWSKDFIPFQSVYQSGVFNGHIKIKHIYGFNNVSINFQKAMKKATEDYENRLKTPKMYQELKRQSLKIKNETKPALQTSIKNRSKSHKNSTIDLKESSDSLSSSRRNSTTKKEIKKLQNKNQDKNKESKQSKKFEIKKVTQIHQKEQSKKFSQNKSKNKNKTQMINNKVVSNSKYKVRGREVDVPISLQLKFQDSNELSNNSKIKFQGQSFCSKSSKSSKKSCKKQPKQQQTSKNIPNNKKRGFNQIQDSNKSLNKLKNQQQIVKLEQTTKKRKGSKAHVSVSFHQPVKNQFDQSLVHYSDSVKLQNNKKQPIKKSGSIKMVSKNCSKNNVKKQQLIIKRQNNHLGKLQNVNNRSSSSQSILSYSSQTNKISKKFFSCVEPKEQNIKPNQKIKTRGKKNSSIKHLKQEQIFELSGSLSKKSQSISQKSSSKQQSKQKQAKKGKASKKQSKKIPIKDKKENFQVLIKEQPNQSIEKIVSKSLMFTSNFKRQKISLQKSEQKSIISNASTKIKQETNQMSKKSTKRSASKPKANNKKATKVAEKKPKQLKQQKSKSKSKKTAKVLKKQPNKRCNINKKQQQISVQKTEQKSEQSAEISEHPKQSKYELLLSRVFYDHYKNKFPTLGQRGAHKKIYVTIVKDDKYDGQVKSQQIKTFDEIIGFVKRSIEQMKTSKNILARDISFIITESSLSESSPPDPFVLRYSQLSQKYNSHKIVLEQQQTKPIFKKNKIMSIFGEQIWSVEDFWLQSIWRMINSWNIVSFESGRLLCNSLGNQKMNMTGINNKKTMVEQRQQSSLSISRSRGRGKSGKKQKLTVNMDNTIQNNKIKCHSYCQCLHFNEQKLIKYMCQLIRTYRTYFYNFQQQSKSLSNNLSKQQKENKVQNKVGNNYNCNTKQELFQLKRRYRRFTTFTKGIETQIGIVMRKLMPLIIESEEKMVKCQQSKQESSSMSISQKQKNHKKIMIEQQSNRAVVSSSRSKSKDKKGINTKNSNNKNSTYTNKKQQKSIKTNKNEQQSIQHKRMDNSCWLSIVSRQLQQFKQLIVKMREAFQKQISRLQKQQYNSIYYLGGLVKNKKSNNNRMFSMSHRENSGIGELSQQKESLITNKILLPSIPMMPNFTDCMQLPQKMQLQQSPQHENKPGLGLMALRGSKINYNNSMHDDNGVNLYPHFKQTNNHNNRQQHPLRYQSLPNRQQQQFQQFLKRVLNVDTLGQVCMENKVIFAPIDKKQSLYNQLNNNQIQYYKNPQYLQCQLSLAPLSSRELVSDSWVSFSQMQSVKSQILNAFDQLQNELLNRQNYQMDLH